jgi:creatinine amidohydrolase
MTAEYMEHMTWHDLRDAAQRNTPVVLAVGACEQHGPHLPLATDAILPVAVAEAAGQHIPLVIAPPVSYGARSRALVGGGETFPGTVSLRAGTLINYLTDILVGLAKSGFRQIVVLNWHLENAGVLWESCQDAADRSPGAKFLLIENPFPEFREEQLAQIFPDGFRGWEVEHASAVETSMMMVVRPDLVRADRIVDDSAERHPSWDVIPAPSEFIPKTGVLARATTASAEIGQLLLEATTTRLVEAITSEFDLN